MPFDALGEDLGGPVALAARISGVLPASPSVTLHDVELAAVGDHNATTGPTRLVEADLLDMVAAAADPTIDEAPVHPGHFDPRFPRLMDGEPALGWARPTRVAGGKLIGDLVDVPAALAGAVLKAYRRRSVEFKWNVQAPSGRRYRAVLAGLGMLGVTPPAVKGLADVAARYVYATSDVAGDVAVIEFDDTPGGCVFDALGEAFGVHDGAVVPMKEGPVPLTDDRVRQLLNLQGDADVAAIQAAITAAERPAAPAPGTAPAAPAAAPPQLVPSVLPPVIAGPTGQPLYLQPDGLTYGATPAAQQLVTPPPAVPGAPSPAPGQPAPPTSVAPPAAPATAPTAPVAAWPPAPAPAVPQPGTTATQPLTVVPAAPAAPAAAPVMDVAAAAQLAQAAGFAVLSAGQLAELQTQAQHGAAAMTMLSTQAQQQALAAALRTGRLSTAELPTWSGRMALDPAGTTQLLTALTPGRVPVSEIGAGFPADASALASAAGDDAAWAAWEAQTFPDLAAQRAAAATGA